MNDKAIAARKSYYRKYRELHKKKIQEQQKVWRQNNSDKIKAYQEKYWSKKSAEMEA